MHRCLQCFESALLQGFQSFFGGLMDAALIGIFFAKISRPGTRARTVRPQQLRLKVSTEFCGTKY